MTDSSLAPFDPKALQERVAKTVQTQFGMLIPEDQFQSMVAKEVTAYFELETKFILEEEPRKEGRDSWSTTYYTVTYAKMTPFRKQVWDALSKLVTESLDKKLTGDLFLAAIDREWSNNGTATDVGRLSDLLQAKLEQLAPKMVASMFQTMFTQAVITAKSDIMREVGEKLANR